MDESWRLIARTIAIVLICWSLLFLWLMISDYYRLLNGSEAAEQGVIHSFEFVAFFRSNFFLIVLVLLALIGSFLSFKNSKIGWTLQIITSGTYFIYLCNFLINTYANLELTYMLLIAGIPLVLLTCVFLLLRLPYLSYYNVNRYNIGILIGGILILTSRVIGA